MCGTAPACKRAGMAKKPVPQDDETKLIAHEARIILGDAYLAKRPSYQRVVKRLQRKNPQVASVFDRQAYLLLSQEIRRLERSTRGRRGTSRSRRT